MRSFVSALAAANLFACSALAPMARAEPCARPAEVRAFEVASLKSELMVVAIACQAQDRYNDFIIRFRRDLQIDERDLSGYFTRIAGRRGQQWHDNYITNLANAQSENGVQQGTLFCQRNLGLFNEVMALPTGQELPSYAHSKSLPQPIDLSECPASRSRKRLHTASEK